MAENYGTLEGTLDEHGELSGEMSDRATLEGEIQFGSGGGGVLDVFQNGQSVVQGRYAYVTVPTFLKDLRADDYHNTVTTLEIQNWNGKADPSDIPENITDLSDVAVDNIQNGQVLKWDATQEKFVNANESGGGGDVTDVKVDGTSVVDPVTKEANIDLTGYAETSDIPTDLADLSDDSTHRLVTDTEKSTWDNKADVSDIPTVNNNTITIQKNGQNVDSFTLNQDSNKAINIAVPTKTSDLQNDDSFITNTVNNLANYYLKSDTYTQTEVNNLISAAVNGRFEKVTTLPASGEPNVIYLVPKTTALTNNVYDEYIWQDNAWELLGSTEIDLSNYVTTTDLSTALADYVTSSTFNTTIANYYTKTEVGNLLDGKVDKVSGKGLSTYDYDATAKGIVDNVTTNLAGKVDKVNGKGLSTEDYTTTEKNKLAGISTGANKVEASTTNGNIKIDGTETQVYDGSGKVDKVNGKGLSTNDYDNTDKVKVDMIDNTTTSATGNPISIADLKSAQIALNPVITFEPIQAGSGTPSPSNIRAISGYDKVEVESCGKNLISAWEQGSWSDSGGNSGSTTRVKNTVFLTNLSGSYAVSAQTSVSGKILRVSVLGYTYTNGTYRKVVDSSWQEVGYTFTAERGIYYGFQTSFSDNSTITPSSITGMQVEKGTSATTYKPYHKTTDLSESLGQTVYGGSLDVRTGKLTIKYQTYTMTGDETFINQDYGAGAKIFYLPFYVKGTNNGRPSYSSHFVEDPSYGGWAGVEQGQFITVPDNYCGFYYDGYNADAKSWVQTQYNNGTPVQFTVLLKTPFTIQLTPHEISLLKDYAYVSTNGTSIALDYHNGELATHADVEQLAETVNELGDRTKEYTDSVANSIRNIIPKYTKVPISKNSTKSLTVGTELRGSKVYLITNSTNVSRLAVIAMVNSSSLTGVFDLVTPTYMSAAVSSGVLNVTNNTNYDLSLNLYEFEGG